MKTTLMGLVSAAAVAALFGVGLVSAEMMVKLDSKPGPADTVVDGKISKIEGPVYTIQSESTGYQNLGTTTNVTGHMTAAAILSRSRSRALVPIADAPPATPLSGVTNP